MLTVTGGPPQYAPPVDHNALLLAQAQAHAQASAHAHAAAQAQQALQEKRFFEPLQNGLHLKSVRRMLNAVCLEMTLELMKFDSIINCEALSARPTVPGQQILSIPRYIFIVFPRQVRHIS